MTKRTRAIVLSFLIILLCTCSDEPNKPPELTITATPHSGNPPLTVNFRVSAYDPEGTALAYEWDFGDGTGTSSTQNPSHIYADSGLFTATCTVTDSGNPPRSNSRKLEIAVNHPRPEITSISPVWSVTHMPAFTLTVTGTNFVPASVIYFRGEAMETEYIDNNTLTCEIRPADTRLSAGTAAASDEEFKVVVRTPGPGGGNSSTASFSVRANHTFTPYQQLETRSREYFNPYTEIKSSGAFELRWIRDYYMMKISYNGGANWGKSIRIPIYGDIYRSGWVVRDDENRWHCAWSNGWKVIYHYSDTEMYSWSDQITLHETERRDDWCEDVRIVRLESGRLIASWTEIDRLNGNYNLGRVMMSYSDDGVTWSDIEPVYGYNSEDTSDLVIKERPDGQLHMMCRYGEHMHSNHPGVFYKYSTDDGSNWSELRYLSGDSGTTRTFPCIGVEGDLYLPIVEASENGKKLSFKISEDHGATWSTAVPVGTVPFKEVNAYAILDDSAGNLYAVYNSTDNSGNKQVYYHRSIDGGITWTGYLATTGKAAQTGTDSYAIDSAGNLYIAWQNPFYPNAVYFAGSEKNLPFPRGE